MEKALLEEKVDHARFGYIVLNRDYYAELIQKMQDLLGKMQERVTGTNAVVKDLLKVECGGKWLNDKIYDIVENSITVDSAAIQRRIAPLDKELSKEVQLFSQSTTPFKGDGDRPDTGISPFKTPVVEKQ